MNNVVILILFILLVIALGATVKTG